MTPDPRYSPSNQKKKPDKPLSITMELPSGRTADMEAIKNAFRIVFASDAGSIVLDYLKHVAGRNPQHTYDTVDATTATYNLARYELIAHIEKLSR